MAAYPRHHASAALQRGDAQFQRHAQVPRPESPQLLQREHRNRFTRTSCNFLDLAAPGTEASCARIRFR